MKRIPFPILILFLKSSGVFASQPLGPEFPLDTTRTYNNARYEQSYPAITFDGSNYLVVWQDSRRLTDYDIFGTRVGFDGRILDPGGIILSMAPELQSFPAVASGFLNSIVVWLDGRDNEIGSGLDIYGCRVTPTGAVLDPAGIFISSGFSNPSHPTIAYGGTNYLVVWQDYDLDPDDIEIYGVRLDMSGIPIDGSPFSISKAPGHQHAPSIAYDGANYLVVWEDKRNGINYDIYGARVNPNGMVLDSLGIQLSNGVGEEWNPAVAFDGTNYLAVWQSESDTFMLLKNFDIYGRRIATDGTLLDSLELNISTLWTETLLSQQVLPTVSFDGLNYLVSWLDKRDLSNYFNLYGTRVGTDGTVLDTFGIPISIPINDIYYPAATSNGANHLIVWKEEFEQDIIFDAYRTEIFGRRVNPDGTVVDPQNLILNTQSPFQEIPVLAFGGTNALVTWGETFDVFYSFNEDSLRTPGIRVDPMGSLTDPIPFMIDRKGLYPSISFDGTNFMISSIDMGFLIDTSGSVVDSFSGYFDSSWRHSISFDGTNHMILTSRWDSDTIRGIRMDPLGNGIPPIIQVAPHSPWKGARHSAIAFDGTNYLVVWFGRSEIMGDTALLAGRVTSDAVLLDSSGVFISPSVALDLFFYSLSSNRETPLSIAYGGNQYLVVWEDVRNDASKKNTDIYGARITPGGIVLDTSGIPISTAVNNQWNPSVAFDGRSFLVVWEDYRNGSSDISGTEVASNGVVLDPGGIRISDGNYPNEFPELVRVGDGRSLVVYQSFRPTPYGSYRIYGRLFESSVGVVEEEITFPISQFLLFQNRPNPFNSASGGTVVSYQLSDPAHTSLKVYDISGRLVETLVNEIQKPGVYQIPITSHQLPSSGIYFYRLQIPLPPLLKGARGIFPLLKGEQKGDFTDTKKMILLK